MAEYRVIRLQIEAPPADALLPRWSYNATLQDTTSGELKSVSFLSDTENPETPKDTCNTIAGLAGVGSTLDFDCDDL